MKSFLAGIGYSGTALFGDPAMVRLAAALALLSPLAMPAEDWPQFRGPNRESVWNETGILQTFPTEGLKIRWRAQVGAGASSPVVAGGRVYVTDSELEEPRAWERVHCFDEKTGKRLWTFSDFDVLSMPHIWLNTSSPEGYDTCFGRWKAEIPIGSSAYDVILRITRFSPESAYETSEPDDARGFNIGGVP